MSAQHPMFSDELREIVDSFVIETKEIFERLDIEILEIEKRADDKELINSIFRGVHTVKGTSGFLSFDQMSAIAHRFEDVLNKLRRGELKYNPGMLEVMLEAFDLMKVLLKQVTDRHVEEIDLSSTINKLMELSSSAKPETTLSPLNEEQARQQQPGPSQQHGVSDTSQQEAFIPRESLHHDNPVHQPDQAQKLDKVADTTIRVDVGRLDSLMNLVGELVLGRNRLSQIVTTAEDNLGTEDFARQLNETSSQIDFITTELQTAVMKTRMVQIGRVFNRFPRFVHDIAREFSKEIDLVVEGEETELDKSIIEEISDPLVHLIRNAADHGIEPPDAREALGKPRRGTIHLSAGHEGNHIVIEIQDDGAGIDPERVKQKAIEKGMLTREEANEMKTEDTYSIIFIPGFTTAQKVSSVSGRGVGLDVVKTNITKLNGMISVDSAVGRGTKFTLKLPLTLAIIQGLLVGVGEETFAIPLGSVLEVVHTPKRDISTVHGRAVIRLRELVLPLVEISEILGVPGHDESAQSLYTVVVGVGNHKFGIVVDRLIGQKEIVIKPLGAYLKNVPGIAGSTILGDGRVIMILDSGELLRLAQKESALRAKVSGEMSA